MITLAAVPFAVAMVLRWCRPVRLRRIPPAVATWLITAVALTVSLTCGVVLSAAAALSLAQVPYIARLGHWSATSLAAAGVPPAWLGVAAAVVVVALLGAAAVRGGRSVRGLLSAQSALRYADVSSARTIVIADEQPLAYAVGGGKRGRIVVSTAMLDSLSEPERRALLAHEAAHLRQYHFAFIHLTELAAAANPLLRPLVVAVRHSAERWADETAAREVGDRRVVASGLARAALASSGRAANMPSVLGSGDSDVVARVRALTLPRPRWELRLSATLAVAFVACWLSAGSVAMHADAVLDWAVHIRSR